MTSDTRNLCLQLQFDEIEVLGSIYGDAWKCDSQDGGCFATDIDENGKVVSLYLSLPETYPLESPPTFLLTASCLTSKQNNEIKDLLNEEYISNIGNGVIYQWIEIIREYLRNISPDSEGLEEVETVEAGEANLTDCEVPEIIHGEVITDRKSSFQPHLARVHSVEQVGQVLEALKSIRKIGNATHNIYAYRIAISESKYAQAFDDDGEHQAGACILQLLQILDVTDVLVVVTRWYGGIHLGLDRFKHIKIATRQIIEQVGLLPVTSKK